jgi:hypothetical protein
MTVYVADTHAHVQRLVSVVKMAILLDKCTTEEKHCCAFFLWEKELNEKNIHNEMFSFTMGSVYRVKSFPTGWQMFR